MPTDRELAAIDAIRAAMQALDHADAEPYRSRLAVQRTPGISPDPTAYGHLWVALTCAWNELGLPGETLRELMIDSGEGAAYVLQYWRETQEA